MPDQMPQQNPLQDLLELNQLWAAGQVARDPEFFARHTDGQTPRLVVVSCSDSRIPLEIMLGEAVGTLFVHRNIANVVAPNDSNTCAVMQYAVETLKVPDIVVIGHFGCGGVAAACSENPPDGYVGDWLMSVTRAGLTINRSLAERGTSLERESFLREVVKENVRRQVQHLMHLTVVRKARVATNGVPRLHGWVYDIGTGLIETVVDWRDVTLTEIPGSIWHHHES